MSAVRFTFFLVYLVLNFGTFASGIALAQTEYSEDSLIRKVQAPDPQSLRFSRNSGNETDFEENGSNQFVPAGHSKSFPDVTYCSASGGCSEYISRVQFGTIDNVTGCSGYANYTATHSANLPLNGYEELTITNGAPYAGDQCGVWIDWNKDGDFDDADETLYVSTLIGKFTAHVSPPQTATTGPTRMRIRITWSGTLSPCGTTTYGEVEDYTINITPKTWNYWTGATNNNWDNPGNWSLGAVPTGNMSVYVPFLAVQPLISGPQAYCFDLVLGGNATLTMNNGTLYVMGDFDAGFGQFTMLSTSKLNFNGSWSADWWDDNQNDIYTSVECVKPNESIVTLRYGVTCSGTVNWYGGKLEIANGANLKVTSTSPEALTIQSISSPFFDATLKLNPGSAVTVNGGIYFRGNSMVELIAGTITCGGNFRFSNFPGNDLNLSYSTLVMNGTGDQYIQHESDSDLILGDLTINKASGKVYVANKNLKVRSVSIINGVLSSANSPSATAWYNISVSGNWSNNNFPNGFEPGTAKVIFNGSGTQNITTSENFNTLEVDRTGAISINSSGTNVTCNSYSWVSGGLEVINGATFTALDLAQQGLFGSYRVNAGSTMNLYQDNTQWVDLDADVFFDGGGTINVYGGNGDSWWAFSRNASLTMNGGVLDFKDNGITVNNSSYSLNVILTGYSVIRTTGRLNMNRTGFAPVGGTFELYGSLDRTISMGTTNSLPNVIINKSSKGEGDNLPVEPVFDARSGSMLTDGSRANQVSLTTNARITGDLTVLAGTLALNGRTLTADKNVTVYGTLKMTNALDVLNAGTSQVHDLAFKNGSVASITQGNLNVYGWLTTEDGCSFILPETVLVSFKGNNGGGPDNRELSARYGSVSIDKNPGHAAYISNWSTETVILLGNLSVKASNTFYMQNQGLVVFSNFYDTPTSTVFLSFASASAHASGEGSRTGNPGSRGGYLAFYSDVTLNGTLNMGDGELVAYGIFNTTSTSNLSIHGGYFRSELVQPDAWNVFSGTLTMTNGIIEIGNSVLVLNGMPKIMSDGFIVLGSNFIANTPGIFQPTGGTVSFEPKIDYRQLTCSNGNFFHNLTIDALDLDYYLFINQTDPLNIANDFNNYSGELYSNGTDIYVGGNWFNWGGYHPMDNMVVFNGSSDQSVTGINTFYDLQNDKSGGSLQFLDIVTVDNIFYANNDNTINAPYFHIVNSLDLSSGSLQIDNGPEGNVTTSSFLMGGSLEVQSGNFTANDLENNGLFGSISILGADAVCNLNQDFSQHTDLNGNVIINDGLLKISGGNDISYWPYYGNGSLTMNGGTLDFNNTGIYINTTGNFTNWISGGTIRTSGSFIVDRNDYNPWGGMTELYSDVYAYVNTMGGSNLHHLTINKTPEEGYIPVSFTDRNGKNITMNRGGMVEMTANLNVAGILDIQEGTLKTGYPGLTLTCGTNTGAASVVIGEGGTLELGPLTTLKLDQGLIVEPSGKFSALGSPEGEVLITRAGVNNYYFDVNAVASFAADYTIFEYMGINGIHINEGAIIDPGKAFNYCTFRLGQLSGVLLTLNSGQELTSTGAIFPTNTWSGLYNVARTVNTGSINFTQYNGAYAGPVFENDPFNRILWGDESTTHNISLAAGWSGLSSYVMPADNAIVEVFDPVSSSFIIAQTMTGAYYPSGGMNTVVNWENQSAYKVKMNSPATLPIVGLEELNKTYNLTSGWNLVPVISAAPVDVVALFSGTGLVIAKDIAGVGVYWPDYGINTIGNLLPGSAYYALMNTSGAVTFPSSPKNGWNGEPPAVKHPAHPWNKVNMSPSSHLIAIEISGLSGLMAGDIIGVFGSNGDCYGVTKITSTTINAFITAYADDELTIEKDGFGDLEPMAFKVYRPSTGESADLEVEYNLHLPQTGYFTGEGLSAIKMLKVYSTGIGNSDESQVSIYPNPTDGLIWITGIDGFSSIDISGGHGTSVKTISTSGLHSLSIDISGLSSGIYQVRISGVDGIAVKRLIRK